MLRYLENNHSGNLAVQSARYLNWLNQPLKSKINHSALTNRLTKNERVIFDLLNQRKNQVVSHEEIAETIWQEKTNEKYSLYAISKTIQRLRKRFRNSGVKTNLIHSQRGHGYILYD
jgi:DNA-binding response OmpR family regulator